MSDNILHIDSVSKSFVKNIVNVRGEEADERYFIIKDLSLYIPKGKITALIGGNGTGKTTLFNIISGFVECDFGQILYKTNHRTADLTKRKSHEIATLGIGRMFQDNHIFLNLTVLDNMLIADSNNYGELPYHALFRLREYKKLEKNRIEKAKKIFEDIFEINNPFWKMRNQKAQNLSYGQQRLLGLARLLMGNYKILLLDEPTSGVNPVVVEKIKELIKYFVVQKGLTIFLIEHNMNFVLDVADFCNFISQGIIAVSGTPEDIIGNPQVRETYLGI